MTDIAFHRRTAAFSLTLAVALALGACSQMPTTGPSHDDIERTLTAPGQAAVQLVDVDQKVASSLAASRKVKLFSEGLAKSGRAHEGRLGAGDSVEIHIWEAPPATLFGGGAVDTRAGVATSRPTALPEQVVDREGYIVVPFVGRVRVAGELPQAVEAEIAQRLRNKANQPEVLLRVTRSSSSMVTVVGEVANSLRMPLTASGERLLDALAAAGDEDEPAGHARQ
jgi:polysaccharide export outer membrane protein